MHTTTHRAAQQPLVSSRRIGDRLRARPTAIATAIIAMMGMAGSTRFASPAFAQGNAASVARASDPFTAFVAEASQRFGIPVSWIRAVIHAESGDDAHALSPKGAMGLMQIMPATWASLRARHGTRRQSLRSARQYSGGCGLSPRAARSLRIAGLSRRLQRRTRSV